MMKRILLMIMILLCVSVVLCSCGGETTDSNDTQTADPAQTDDAADTNNGDNTDVAAPNISSIFNYNKDSELGSHDDEWKNSHLELSYRDRTIVDSLTLTTKEAWYPRVKQTANGEYILIYMGDYSTGNHIYIARSKDLKVWYGVEKLFAGSAASDSSPLYASADAIVLANGDILVAAGYRGYKTYRGDSSTNGIRIRRSTDNGATWSEPETIYTGGVWEPSFLQLDSGEVQIYWTNTHVEGAPVKYGGRTDDNSTGTAMLRSFDNGKTWNGNVNVPYTAQIVAQQFTKKGSDGNYYSGQMPVACQLNNGDIVLALEARYGKDEDANKTYNLSFAYTSSENSWSESLGDDEEGPSTLKTNVIKKAAGPYIRQFKSGETILSYHWGNDWFTLIGNATATEFNERMEAFGPDVNNYIWGSTEIIDSHVIIGTAPASSKTDIYVGKFILNHTIDSVKKSISVNGELSDWSDVDQAFFVGSDSQAQASIRVCEDDEYLYLTAEVLDYFISSDDKMAFLIGNFSTGKYLNFFVTVNGKITVNKGGISIKRDQIEASVSVNGTIDEFKNKDKGYVIELKLPKSVFGETDTLIFNPMLYNKDKADATLKSDSIGILSMSDVSNWLKIKLAK